MYAQLAKLTKEDGTGEISLDMDVDEIVAVFDKYGIPYQNYSPEPETVEDPSPFVQVGENSYKTNWYAGYGWFVLQQTYKGLKVGDTVEKVLELYGEPDEIYNYAGNKYTYVQKKIDNGESRIIFRVTLDDDDIVKRIIIGAEMPHYGGETY